MVFAIAGNETRKTALGIESTINRAFLMAHLLTANSETAESAILEAIDLWGSNDEEALFEQVLSAAKRNQIRPSSSNRAELSGSPLPAELNAVLNLSPHLRQPFVLRVLVGLSRQRCARLLHLSCRRVDEYTCEALKVLSSHAEQSTAALKYVA